METPFSDSEFKFPARYWLGVRKIVTIQMVYKFGQEKRRLYRLFEKSGQLGSQWQLNTNSVHPESNGIVLSVSVSTIDSPEIENQNILGLITSNIVCH
jgi:hypothetical protein